MIVAPVSTTRKSHNQYIRIQKSRQHNYVYPFVLYKDYETENCLHRERRFLKLILLRATRREQTISTI